jgi:hypothetical protein
VEFANGGTVFFFIDVRYMRLEVSGQNLDFVLIRLGLRFRSSPVGFDNRSNLRGSSISLAHFPATYLTRDQPTRDSSLCALMAVVPRAGAGSCAGKLRTLLVKHRTRTRGM